jgi:hypothetical protein
MPFISPVASMFGFNLPERTQMDLEKLKQGHAELGHALNSPHSFGATALPSWLVTIVTALGPALLAALQQLITNLQTAPSQPTTPTN